MHQNSKCQSMKFINRLLIIGFRIIIERIISKLGSRTRKQISIFWRIRKPVLNTISFKLFILLNRLQAICFSQVWTICGNFRKEYFITSSLLFTINALTFFWKYKNYKYEFDFGTANFIYTYSKVNMNSKSDFKRFLVYKNKSHSDLIWRIQLICIKG